jgi:hypothetical protein
MPILNYTTEVPAQNTVSQIIGMLARKGAQSITQDFMEDGRVKAVSFVLRVGVMPVRFMLPANTEGVAGVLKKEKPYTHRSSGSLDGYYAKQREQAERIAWRILKDWIEAQMALIESGQAEAAQVFMPYATEPRTGQTMYALWSESNQKQLTSGGDDEN